MSQADATHRFAEAIGSRVTDQSSLWSAQASLASGVRQGMQAARLLDVVVVNAFGARSPECETWRQIRRVQPERADQKPDRTRALELKTQD